MSEGTSKHRLLHSTDVKFKARYSQYKAMSVRAGVWEETGIALLLG